MKKRNPRVDRTVRDALAAVLESEVADPRLTFVSITEVQVTPDHDHATVYYSTLDPSLVQRDPRQTGGDRLPDAEEVEEALAAVTPMLRSLLGRRTRLRVTPQLKFVPDPVAAQADRVEQLLRNLEDTGGPADESDGD